jgi:hypothetical protein
MYIPPRELLDLDLEDLMMLRKAVAKLAAQRTPGADHTP